MNRTIHKKNNSKETLFTVATLNAGNLYDGNCPPQRWERKLTDAIRADYLMPREKAVDRILELAKAM